MVTLDHLGEEELKNLSKEHYKYNTLEVIRNDGATIEYILINGIYEVSNKLMRKGF
jgi:hypothetical protein